MYDRKGFEREEIRIDVVLSILDWWLAMFFFRCLCTIFSRRQTHILWPLDDLLTGTVHDQFSPIAFLHFKTINSRTSLLVVILCTGKEWFTKETVLFSRLITTIIAVVSKSVEMQSVRFLNLHGIVLKTTAFTLIWEWMNAWNVVVYFSVSTLSNSWIEFDPLAIDNWELCGFSALIHLIVESITGVEKRIHILKIYNHLNVQFQEKYCWM
jgi:hypothetical protein